MPTGSYSVSFSLLAGITPRQQPKIKYNNSTLDRVLSSLCVLGQCLGSGQPRSTRNLCGRQQLQRAQSAIRSHRFDYQIKQVAQMRRFPISYREKTQVKMKSL